MVECKQHWVYYISFIAALLFTPTQALQLRQLQSSAQSEFEQRSLVDFFHSMSSTLLGTSSDNVGTKVNSTVTA